MLTFCISKSCEACIHYGKEVADDSPEVSPKPVSLELEKGYYAHCLKDKKRYRYDIISTHIVIIHP